MPASNKKRKVDHETPAAKATKSVSAGREPASSDPRFKMGGDFWGEDVWCSDADVDLVAAAAGPGPGSATTRKKNSDVATAAGGRNVRSLPASGQAAHTSSSQDSDAASDDAGGTGDADDDADGDADKGPGGGKDVPDGEEQHEEAAQTASPDSGGTSDFDAPGDAGEGQAADGTAQSGKKIKVLSKRKLQRVNEASERRGIVYISRIPPHMKPHKLRQLLEPFGDIGRVYLAPEDPALRRMRKKKGGNSGKNFTEGWVEFEDKRRAKRAALALNGQPMGGSKRSAYHYDLWNLKYLSKFKWDTLTEEINYQRAVREQRLVAEISAAKRERDFYLSRVDKAKAISAIQERRAKKGQEGQQAVDGGAAAGAAAEAVAAAPPPAAGSTGGGQDPAAAARKGPRFERHFGQRKAKADPVLDDRAPVLADDVLGLLGRAKRTAQ